jgi:hypothetical protein
MDRLKRIEDQIRLQESLIGSLRYQLTQRRPQESHTAITAQLTHALAGLSALCRADEADERSGGEAAEAAGDKVEAEQMVLMPSDIFKGLASVDLQPIRDIVESVNESVRNIQWAMNSQAASAKMQLPIGTLLITPDDVSDEFLKYLEEAGIPGPGDDLEFVVITDPSLVPKDIDAELSVGSFGGRTDYWALDECDPLWSILARSASTGNSIEWYKVEFSIGWRAVGICSN